MSKKNWWSILPVIAITLFLLLYAIDASRDVNSVGAICLLLTVMYFITGLLLVIPKTTRTAGQTLLICSGVLLLIGISVCSSR